MNLVYVITFVLAFTMCSCDLMPSLSTLLTYMDAFYDKVNGNLEKTKLLLRKLEFIPINPISFSYYSPIEYPGRDKVKLRIIRNLWKNYYECLKRHHDMMGVTRMMPPITYMALEGTTLSLRCFICPSPKDLFQPSKWYFTENMGHRVFEELVETDDIVVAPTTNTLHIFNVAKNHVGLYYCRVGDTYSQPYFVHVFQTEEEPLKVVKPQTAAKGPRTTEAKQLGEHLTVLTKWSSWTLCSRCGKVGIRHRFGACTVRLTKFEARPHIERDHENVMLKELNMMSLFAGGLPCRSQLVPPILRQTPGLLNRPSEVMFGFCKVPCIDSVFEVKDRFGRVLQSANNTGGIFSALQGPQISNPNPVQKFITAEIKNNTRLQCPGHYKVDAPVEWFFKKKRLIAVLLKNQTNGRLDIDILGRLVINNVTFEDDGIYTCHQVERTVGVIRVRVQKPPEMLVIDMFQLINGVAVLAFMIKFVVGVHLGQGLTEVKDPIPGSGENPEEPGEPEKTEGHENPESPSIPESAKSTTSVHDV